MVAVALLVHAGRDASAQGDPDRFVFAPASWDSKAAQTARDDYETNPDVLCASLVAPPARGMRSGDSYCANIESQNLGVIRELHRDRVHLDEERARKATDKVSQEARAWNLRSIPARIATHQQNLVKLEGALTTCYESIAAKELEFMPPTAAACSSYQSAITQERRDWQIPDNVTPDAAIAHVARLGAMNAVELSAATAGLAPCTTRAEATRQTMLKKRRDSAAMRPLDELLSLPPAERLPEEQARIDAAIAQCRAAAATKQEDRRKLAASRPLEELRAIPEQYRLPEEAQRIADETAARLARIEARKRDRKWVAPLLSAAICNAQAGKRAMVAEIKTQRLYAKKYGGVVNMRAIHGLQQDIRAADEHMAQLRKMLRDMKTSAISCSSKAIKLLLQCLPFDEASITPTDPKCQTERVVDSVELWNAL